MKVNNHWGYLTDISAKTKTLVVTSSDFVPADISVISPRKLFIFITQNCVYWIKVSQVIYNLILKTRSLAT